MHIYVCMYMYLSMVILKHTYKHTCTDIQHRHICICTDYMHENPKVKRHNCSPTHHMPTSTSTQMHSNKIMKSSILRETTQTNKSTLQSQYYIN